MATGTNVFITFLPGSDYLETVSLAKRLRSEGMEPVPHFAARSMKDRAQLEDYISRARGEANVSRALVIAGAPDKPSGDFSDSMQLLSTGLFERHGLTSIAVAGHPEGGNFASSQDLVAALKWKANYAKGAGLRMQIVTQFCFEAEPFVVYDRMLQREGIELPLHAGIAGIATLKTLISYAMSCGVGNSINFLKRQAANVTRLLKPEAPDRLVRALAAHRASEPDSRLAALHLFPLGGLRKTAVWTNALVEGKFELNSNHGLDVAADLA